ncbi:MAG TPA: VOC family protein [Miltoncostaeaceae bacterium]|nr:VOC family protein [Miltoncostaeaceae bacterium]
MKNDEFLGRPPFHLVRDRIDGRDEEGGPVDWKLELVVVPVSDVDRAKEFYVERAGFRLDVDHRAGDTFRVVQLTPPGSACSIAVGVGITEAAAGSAQGLHLVVPDIEAARAELVARGADVSEPFHFGPEGRTPGVDPERRDYGSYLSFGDPDGNAWLVQEVRRAAPRPV